MGKSTMPAGIICNNPAPLLLNNGSVAMFCHGPGIRLALAPSYDAPFSNATFISHEGSYPIPHLTSPHDIMTSTSQHTQHEQNNERDVKSSFFDEQK